jgi:adenine-specific DNA-methyltransferase
MKEFEPIKLDKETTDGTVRNLDALYQLFPSCFTEAPDALGEVHRAVDWGKLRELLGEYVEDGEPEKYDFTWVGKRAAQREAAAPCRKTLRPCPEESVYWDTTQNLYIEGDNLEVLKLLQNSYMGKVKMIYIDPPYNTGNDFVYHDDFAQSAEEYDEHNLDDEGNRFRKNTDSNGRFHSDWCSMIYTRLMVARSLLTEDGVIFISIDDNEQRNLKIICDEVFGESNFRNTILTRRRTKSLNSQFADNGLYSMNVGYEYILVYARSTSFLMQALRMKKAEVQTKGRWDVFWSNADRPTMRYDILGFTPTTGQWRNSKEKAEIAVANYIKYEKEYSEKISLEEYSSQTGITDFIRRIPNGIGKNGGVQHWIAPSDTMLRTSNWTDVEVSQIGKEIDLPFENPKNKLLMMELCRLIRNEKDFIILDFFSGSATTAHAVMQLNAEDGGNRKFIMVQLPEETAEDSEAYKAGYKNICEIGKERIRRAGKKIKADSPLTTKDLDIGFRVLKCDESNYKPVAFAPKDYTQESLDMFLDNIKEERTGLDLLFDCMMRWGLELSLPYDTQKVDGCTIYNVDEGNLVACFDGVVTGAVIDAIAETHPLRVVFRDSSFTEAAQKMNLFELFKQKCGWTDQEVQNNVRVI